jgi:hypothetical protein
VKLSRLEKRLLLLIRDAYPIPHDPSSKEILKVGERPVVTDETLFPKCRSTLSEIREAIEKLKQFQLVHSTYLCDPREFAEQYVGAGHRVRLAVMGPPGGPHGQHILQITKHGIDEIEKFPTERLKRAAWKFVEEKGAIAVTGILGTAGGWLLGWFGFSPHVIGH